MKGKPPETITEAEATPLLFSQEVIEALTDPERRGEFTLERLRVLKPEAIEKVIELRGEWWSQLRIAKALKVSPNTVAAIDDAYPERIESLKLKRIKLYQGAADQLVAQIAENPGLVPWQVKALAASQIFDKASLMQGLATTIHGTAADDDVDQEAEWQAYLAKNKGAAKVIDVESERIGLVGENPDQLPRGLPAHTAAAGQVDQVADPEPGSAAGSDISSPGSPRVQPIDPTTDATDQAADRPTDRELLGDPAAATREQAGGAGVAPGARREGENPLSPDEISSNRPQDPSHPS